MELSDIRDEVRNRIAVSSNDLTATDAAVDSLINAALRQIAVEKDWDWLIKTDPSWASTVVGQNDYTPSGNWRTTLYLYIGERKLTQVQPTTIQKYAHVEGPPSMYTVEGDKIRVAPTPTSVQDVRHVYLSQETPLSADTDEPFMPLWAIDYLIVKASILLAGRLGDREYQAILEREAAKLRSSLYDETRRSREAVRPSHRTDTF